jgi:hypothetical protein
MNTVERIASDIALLSNARLAELAEILTRDYPTRAEQLSLSVDVAFREGLNQLYRELGLVNAE